MLGIYGGARGESFQLRWIEMTTEDRLRRSQGSSLGPKYKETSETASPGGFQSYLYFAGSSFRSKLSPTAPLWHHTCTLPLFVGANNEALWQAFLSLLAGLGFLQRWTATMEESTKAQEVGRIHLRANLQLVRTEKKLLHRCHISYCNLPWIWWRSFPCHFENTKLLM